MTTVLKIDPINPDRSEIKQAVRLLKAGKLVVFPTDTVYGIGSDAFNENAVNSIFHVKKRAPDRPLQILISSKDELKYITDSQLEILEQLAFEFWPGPLTIVVPAKKDFPRWVTCGLDTVGIRMPANKIALKLIETFGAPIAATSANISGQPDPVNLQDVIEYLGEEIHLIIDGGPTPGNIPSTVLDISVNPPIVLRQGRLAIKELNRVLNNFGYNI